MGEGEHEKLDAPYWVLSSPLSAYSEKINAGTPPHLTIRSKNGSANCIVQAANPNDYVFEISVDYVKVSDFSPENVSYGISKTEIYLKADHYSIRNNICKNNDHGIYLRTSSDNVVISNTCNSNANVSGTLLIEIRQQRDERQHL